MRIITSRSVTSCWKSYPSIRNSLAVWEERIKNAKCKTHDELKAIFPDADYIPNNNFKHLTIFNIKHNKYRLVVDIFFNTGHIYMKWFGPHSEYDKINFGAFLNRGFTLC